MKWVDVAGAPGSGKSTLCDPLWGPHELPIENRLPPMEWHDFLNEVTRLFILIQKHPSFEAAIRMNNRSIRKIATVARKSTDGTYIQTDGTYIQRNDTYIQTGLVQRGLGFGWRMNQLGIPLRELEHYFRLMPVSVGVVITKCPEEEVVRRNLIREAVKATAHENRDFMVPLMLPAIDVAKKVLLDRGVFVLELSTEGDPGVGRKKLLSFASGHTYNPASDGHSCEVAVFSAPPWFRG